MNTADFHDDQYKFEGYTNSYLKYNKSGEEWYLGVYGKEDSIWATTNATDYPMGTRLWKIVSPTFSGSIDMNLNACSDESEYNCDDGGCISIGSRDVIIEKFMYLIRNYHSPIFAAGVTGNLIVLMDLMSLIVINFILRIHILQIIQRRLWMKIIFPLTNPKLSLRLTCLTFWILRKWTLYLSSSSILSSPGEIKDCGLEI